ncbi:MAG: DUF2341 domain-containing protein [Deltaproteobacteria bacterium]|nr:DUF2341 domain-containing protein [Nannocystaceae bacterium]
MGRRPIFVAAAATGLAIGCSASAFVCASDDDCTGGNTPGVCEPLGACSFDDDDCDSGRRYGDHARDGLAGACVDAPTNASSESTAAVSPGTTMDVTLETTSPPASSDDAPASSSDDGADGCPTTWWDCAWSRRARLRMSTEAAESLTEVPVMVLLDASRIDLDAAAADGADLRFVDARNVVLAHEIERWDAQGVSVVWVTVPSLDRATTTIALYHGNPAAADAQDADAVWADSFVGVWHMDRGTDDSSGHGNHGVAIGGPTSVQGWSGGAQEFHDDDDRFDVPAAASLEDVFIAGGTVSAWARADGFGGTGRGRIVDNTAGGSGGWMFYLASDDGGTLRWRHGYEAGQSIWSSQGRMIEADQWHHVAVTFAADVGALPRMYVDGVEVPSAEPDEPPTTAAVGDAGNDLVIGNSDVPNRWFDGRIDEVRLERGMRSPAWIAVQVQSMRDELVVYGGIERLEDLR